MSGFTHGRAMNPHLKQRCHVTYEPLMLKPIQHMLYSWIIQQNGGANNHTDCSVFQLLLSAKG